MKEQRGTKQQKERKNTNKKFTIMTLVTVMSKKQERLCIVMRNNKSYDEA